ncbi:transporter [Methylotenera sp.]|uniref:transporter n=1 Tax=Methylotenera sp. TaxID=2051956 RepID=UPI00248865A2|nr:transporter [Methylotenera sp.]MDI1361773.1 transporter [Methylotenera sp.]
MKNNLFNLSLMSFAIAGCFTSNVWADGTQDVAQLKQQLGELNNRYEAQSAALQALSKRLQQLENPQQVQARPMHAVNKTVVADDNTQSSDEEKQSTQGSGEPVIKEAPASRSAEAVYREQNALFNKTFTLETGLTYSHSDRRQLTLEGFLALDSIFLGNINLDHIKSDVVQFDVTGRYGITDRLQFDFNAPFIYRTSTYESGGVNNASTVLAEHDVSNSSLGDVSAGAYYRLFPETPSSPDVVWNVRVKAPTGKDPYGIKFRVVPGTGGNLSAPDELPTGNGVWTLSTGFTFVKTIDPAILFANVGYAHNFTHGFDDISGVPTNKIAGEVDLGDSYQLGGGLAFALNDRMSMSMSYAHRFADKSRIKQKGQSWQTIVGSDSSSGSLNFGVTYAMSDRLSMVTSVGMGVTPDAPDVTVGVKFPYNF